MKPTASLFTKILFWFFLNMVIVAAVLTAFFALQPRINLHAIFGQQGIDRLRAAAMLIAHDIRQAPQADWPDILDRHAAIHGVDFMIVLENASRYSSTAEDLPGPVMHRIRNALRHRPPQQPLHPQGMMKNRHAETSGGLRKREALAPRPSRHLDGFEDKPHWRMRTQHPARYWSGLRIPLSHGPLQAPAPAVLLAVSDSLTGNGFFFDPLPWIVVAMVVILVSLLFWVPMVRHITRPITRMTRATEEIAKGRFDVSVHEPRFDEIGRLSRAISHMSARLSAFVKGQKRFLGDVAHELGSPISRIQFGLGALEQRVDGKNQKRVIEVLEDVEHLSKLVNELLAFSRADIKAHTVQLEKIDLLPVIQTAVKREAAPPAKIHTQIDPGLQAVASSDLLTRAVANLLRNALKYAGDAGPIHVIAEGTADKVTLEVRDNGPGVSEELLDQLFEPFFRPEIARDRDSGGVGLGLAIVKTCVETCGGTVSAANCQPKGFSVTIALRAN